jgi:large subunit ribosomal protein L22
MEARAIAKYISLSPLKAQRVARMIRGQSVKEAEALLRFTPNRAARVIEKVLKSAVANAENNYDVARDELFVARAFVDRGPQTRRVQARARGRADVIVKRSAHVTVIVAERERS